MKTAQEWFDEYAISHQNETNQLIHYICVPIIFFSVIGLLMSIPTTFLENTFHLYNPLLENWAAVMGVLISLFYLRLGFWYFVEMLFVLLLCIVLNFWLSKNVNLLYASFIIFVLAWMGQFWGHKVEGKKPSFAKDLPFLLIGPLWVIQKLGKKSK
ncbi:Mpo1-like protein [uncultured Polaribacter sp.]|uniref:Mpo1 family 2-hydroxy fatty acid dioxygenase n=1 Tax=uncultured Polaribacter sp. TaxID=174711 RepID=UPI00261FFBF5|nr:Mpo1-like protein [uncultured Polaribacter sp.]